MQFSSSFASTDVGEYEIRNQGIDEDYFSRLHALLDCLNFNGRAITKLTMLTFLYCGEFVKNSIVRMNTRCGLINFAFKYGEIVKNFQFRGVFANIFENFTSIITGLCGKF